jgi:hypothetical protein
MPRKLAVALLSLLLALTAFAKERAVAPPKQTGTRVLHGSGASVTGEVTLVSGRFISLAGGLVTIDASNAKILGGNGEATLEAITPGALIIATLQEPEIITTGPLAATTIAILRNADVTFTGTAQIVDTEESKLLVLNQIIKVDAGTAFVNFGENASLENVHPNMLVAVEANAAGGTLVASRITLLSPIPPRLQIARGTVKSIGTEAWVIAIGDHDTTFVVNASTRILGSPKAGDKVEVLYTFDTAHANVALSIIKSTEVPKGVRFNGVVKAIAVPRWVVTRDDDHKDAVLDWPESVHFPPLVRVGDRVTVVAIENADGTYRAIAILPRR